MLLEIAIALSIITIISGFFITRGTITTKLIREQRTKNNIEIVNSALASYLAINRRLPKPSLPEDNGFESNNTNLAMGNIPYNTLGIAEKHTIDSKGKPLIYIVEPKLTNNFTYIYDNPEQLTSINCFCMQIINPKIQILSIKTANSIQQQSDIVIFAIDSADNPPMILEDRIIIKPTTNTMWMRRNIFLIHYLKSSPCENEKMHTVNNRYGNAEASSPISSNKSEDPFD